MDRKELASRIDQTLLKPTVGFHEAATWMHEQRDEGFATLCVAPFLVSLAAGELTDTTTRVCSVAGFPFGYSDPRTKAVEARRLVQAGAHEVDMVMQIAAFLEGETDFVYEDIEGVAAAVDAASNGTGVVKVILETGYLTGEQVAEACGVAERAGAHFVKTSTGFGPRGASVEDVSIMRESLSEAVRIKAAGGIRDLSTAVAMLEAGADRLGSSSGREILEAFEAGRM